MIWRALREAGQEKRAANRANAVKLLMAAQIQFVSKNEGAHLIVDHGRFDCWPGTGLYRRRGRKDKRRGINRLIAEIKGT
jgi:hypothetical protein